MKIHEYQAKELMREFNIPVPPGELAETEEQVAMIAQKLLNGKCDKLFIKAQIHAGGRGKAGGILPAKSVEEAQEAARKILGKKLVTHQTGPEGKLVKKVLVVEGCQEIGKELYVGIVLDRAKERPVIMASTEGGVEIEQVASTNPELILKEYIHPLYGISPFQARKLAFGLNLKEEAFKQGVNLFVNLYKMFVSLDASQVEINPLALLKNNTLAALDSKINFDESALYRHKNILDLRDLSEEEPLEIEAGKFGLNYIKLDGNIGCMVNGAGLAMATMDIIKYYGGSPANFLDVGGGASEESITAAFRILLSDKKVEAVLVNIFGGIVRCDRVAKGIINAVQNISLDRPLVVRLIGTNSVEGNKLLAESGLSLETATSMAEAAEKVVSIVARR